MTTTSSKGGCSPVASPSIRYKDRQGRSFLVFQFPLNLFPCSPGGVTLPARPPVLFGTSLAPGLLWDSRVGTVPAFTRFLGDLVLLPAVLPLVFLSFGFLVSDAIVFPPIFGRLLWAR